MSDDTPPFPKLLSTKEVCAALGIDAKTLRWHVKEGHLPYIVFGSGEERPRRRYHSDDVAAFIRSRTVRGEPTVARPPRGRRVRSSSDAEVIGFTKRLIRINEERLARGEKPAKRRR